MRFTKSRVTPYERAQSNDAPVSCLIEPAVLLLKLDSNICKHPCHLTLQLLNFVYDLPITKRECSSWDSPT